MGRVGFVLLNLSTAVYAQQSIQFQQLSPRDGLSQATIHAIAQDHFGFMWFGTADGLNCFDGYSFRTYYQNSLDSTTISNNEITALTTTTDSTLWVGTNDGLSYYFQEQERFIRIDQELGLPGSRITKLLPHENGGLWVGTQSGLAYIGKGFHEIQKYDQGGYLPSNHITSLAWQGPNMLWVGTTAGLVRVTQLKSNAIKFEEIPNPAWANQEITSIATSTYGQVYVGTPAGLWLIEQPDAPFDQIAATTVLSDNIISLHVDPIDQTLWAGATNRLWKLPLSHQGIPESFMANPLERNSLSDNQILSIYRSRDGILWFGANSGLNYYDPKAIKFGNYSLSAESSLDLITNRIWAILTTPHQDEVWMGTEGGLVRVSPDGQLTRYLADRNSPGSLQDNRIRALAYAPNGTLWVGTEQGLHRFHEPTETFAHFPFYLPQEQQAHLGNRIQALFWENPRKLWCGTENGIYIFDPVTRRTNHIAAEPGVHARLQNNEILFITQDDQGNIWVGTNNGLHKRTNADHLFEWYRNSPINSSSLSNNQLRSMLQDSKGRLWIGTKNGLNLMREDSTFQHFTERDGLPNHVIYGILEDNSGRIWVSTNRGLSVFLPQENRFRNFDVLDGLQGNEFNTGSAAKSDQGRLYFGGINGYNAFFPDSLSFNYFKPQAYITQIDVFGEPLKVGSPSLPSSTLTLDTLYLSYKQDFITIHFTGLSFTQPYKNQYRYQLKGFQDEWINTGNDRNVSFTNLPGGTYVFNLSASNNDQLWGDSNTSLVIIVAPPYWETLWFQAIVICIFLILIIALFQQRTNAIKRQKSELEHTVALRTQQIQEQAASLEEQAASLEKQAYELTRNYEEAKILARIGRQITANINGMELVEFLYNRLSEIINIDLVVVGLFNPDRGRLEMMGWKSPGKPISFHSHSIKETHLPGVYSFVNQKSLLFNHYPADYAQEIGPETPPHFSNIVPQSVIYEPLFKNQEASGFLTIQSKSENAYTEFDGDLVRNLASYVAIAIDNSRAYFQIQLQKEEITRMNEQLEQKVKERTQQLEIQKNKLEEFAQINAHKVRRPLAAMMGLVPLLRWAKNDEQDHLLESLEISSRELDNMVHRMNKILTEQGILTQEEIVHGDISKNKQ